MKMFIGGRGSGKTTHIIKESSASWTPIVCSNPQLIKQMAKEHYIDIPEPISFYEFLNQRGQVKTKTVLIDELGWFLRSLGMEVEEATLDLGDIEMISLNDLSYYKETGNERSDA